MPLKWLVVIVCVCTGCLQSATASECQSAVNGCPAKSFDLLDLASRTMAIDSSVNAALQAELVAKEKSAQARAQLLPSVTWTATRQSNRVIDLELNQAPLQSGFNTQTALQFAQPLFRPQNSTAIDQAEVGVAAANLQIQSAKSELLVRLVGAVMDFLNSVEQLYWSRHQTKALDEHLSQVRKSFAVGTVSITDVRETESKLEAAMSMEEVANFDVLSRQAALQDLTGRQLDFPTDALVAASPAILPTLKAEQLEDFLGKIDSLQPTVLIAKRQIEVSDMEAKKMRQALLPVLDLTASQTHTRGRSTTLYSSSDTNTTQAALTLTIPLFSGGSGVSKVKEAAAATEKVRSELEIALKTARSNARQSFYASLSAISQVRALESNAKYAETTFKFNKRGYEVGIKTNFDVLNGQVLFFQARRDLARSIREAWLQYFKLLNATSSVELDDIANLHNSLFRLTH